MLPLWSMLTLLLGVARAEERAAILRVDGPEVYAALGAADGIRNGDTVMVYRMVTVLDPASGRTLTDHFYVGRGVVGAAGDTLTRILVPAELAVRLRPGDVVGVGASGQPAPSVAAPPPREVDQVPVPRPPAPPSAVAVQTEVRYALSAEAEAFQRAFSMAASADRGAERVQIWRAWLTQWEGSAMADAVRDELASLRRSPEGGSAGPRSPPPLVAKVEATAPARAPEQESVPVVLSVHNPEAVRSATLFYRLQGEETYRHQPFVPQGDTTLMAAIPNKAVLPPGMQWFAEVRDSRDTVATVGGSPGAPGQINISDQPDPIEIHNRSQATVLFEYVDFYAGSGADYYVHGAADFLYRVNKGPFYSMRLGAGSYRGQGGNTAELDRLGKEQASTATQPIGYNFGYSELEFRFGPVFAVMGRGLIGVDDDGMAGGVEGRIRLGREEGTSLDAGAARIGQIGVRYGLHLRWNTVDRLPMGAAVEMTDFPGVSRDNGTALEDYGVRLIYDAEYAFTDSFALGGRLGWALRNVDHAGPSAGLQAVFSW